MHASGRDKKIRATAGLAIIALSFLSMVMIYLSGLNLWSAIPLAVIYGLQALFTLGAGVYLCSGWRKAGALELITGRWRLIGLAAFGLVGTAAVIFGFSAGPDALITTALWPNMVALWILLSFRPMTARFPREEQWTSSLSGEAAWVSLTEAFHQPGLIATTAGQDLWLKISKDWAGGTWQHEDAARYMKVRPEIHFRIDEIRGETRITAHSDDSAVGGMFDVLKLMEEMSKTAVELAQQATRANAGEHS
ncbi:hypothetical protein [Arthrobacter psychrochitiniphilus]|uniref:hypothetical protein n=1 Tax=Arthrobacter psychrochitiniphilus TaxID=291045 RepID=UPI003F7C8A72